MLERCKKRVKDKSRPKNDEVFKLAYCIKEVMELCDRSQDDNLSEAVKKEMEEMCSEESKSHLEELKSELPKSVKNVVFAPEVCITNVYNEYLYAAVADFNYDKDRSRVFTWVPSKKNNPPGSCTGDKQAMWKVEDFWSINSRSNKRGLSNKVTLDSDSLKTVGISDKLNDTYVLASSGRLENYPLLDSYNQTRARDIISQMTNPKSNEGREKSVLNKRLAAGLSNRSEMAVDSTSTTTRSSSWINSLLGWVKGSVGGLFYSRVALPEETLNTEGSMPQVDTQFSKASVGNSSSNGNLDTEEILKHKLKPGEGVPNSTNIKPSIGRRVYNYFARGKFSQDNVNYVNANLKQAHEEQMPFKFKPKGENKILEMGNHYLSQADFNGTIMLLDLLIRKITGQKYISSVENSVSLLEAQDYASRITNGFERLLNETAIKSGISVTNLNFDPVAVQSAIVRKIRNGEFSKIPKILYSFAKEAYPEFQQTDKFLVHLRSQLEVEKETALLQQEVEKPSKILDQQASEKVELSKKPDTFLNETSVVKGISSVLER